MASNTTIILPKSFTIQKGETLSINGTYIGYSYGAYTDVDDANPDYLSNYQYFSILISLNRLVMDLSIKVSKVTITSIPGATIQPIENPFPRMIQANSLNSMSKFYSLSGDVVKVEYNLMNTSYDMREATTTFRPNSTMIVSLNADILFE